MTEPTTEDSRPIVTIVRGVPCSGKTATARTIAAEYDLLHLDVDMFLTRNGIYDDTPERRQVAWKGLLMALQAAGKAGCDVIISGLFPKQQDLEEIWKVARQAYNDKPFSFFVKDLPTQLGYAMRYHPRGMVAQTELPLFTFPAFDAEWEEWHPPSELKEKKS